MSSEKLNADNSAEDSSPEFERKSGRIDPPDYEKVLLNSKAELRQDEFPNLLLFPQQDVIVKAEPRDHRTAVSTVPHESLDLPTTLFTHECLKFYSSHWEKVTYNFTKHSGSYALLLDEEAREALPHLTFERDKLEADAMSREEDDSSKQVSKSGYLSKGVFPGDQSTTSSMSAKSYKKHRFQLRHTAQAHGGSSYTLSYYGEEKSGSSSIKGMIPTETITEIKKNPKHKPYGFDLLTEDEKTLYPLAADSEKEMDDWIEVLKKALGLENEDQQTGVIKPMYDSDTLKDVNKRSLLRPELLQYSEGSAEKENRLNRQAERNDIFVLYPELLHEPPPEAEEGLGPAPKEMSGIQVHVVCESLHMRLCLTRSGISQLLEPFFIKLALFDAQKGIKISEDLHIDLNEPNIRSLVPKRKKLVRVGLDYEEIDFDFDDDIEEMSTIESTVNNVKEGIFSVLFPSPDIYLVARIEKVLHNTIQSCAEPYQKTGDITKTADKLSKQMGAVCGRLGSYRMPFAWTARPVFKSATSVNEQAEFGPLFRQDKERLTDEDLMRYLNDFRNISKQKLSVIAGALKISVKQFSGGNHAGMIVNPSYIPLKLSNQKQQSSKATPTDTVVPAVKEIREFAPYDAYEPHNHYDPYLSLTHNLYVYPLSLNYENQKQFAKARNIAIKVEFKESDYGDSAPLKVIYSRSIGEAYTFKAVSHVLYHSQSPTFYEEVKVKLPVRLSRRHHVLVTFLHINCDLPKSNKHSARLPPVETIVGYSWIPLLEVDGKINSGVQSLPVATTLPAGYLSALRGDLKKPDIPACNIAWVDGAKLLFKIKLKLDSTIYTEDSEMFTFFSICDHVQRGKSVPLDDLKFAIESLHDIDFLSLFHLPVLFNMLLRLLCFSQEPVPEIKLEVLKVIVSLISKLVSNERQDILKSYIDYMFVTERDPISGQAVHDELVVQMTKYLEQKGKGKEVIALINFVPFFLEIILKSMAQFLGQVGKENASRKTRYPEELGTNLEALIEKLIPKIIVCHMHPSGTKANQGLGRFLKHCFSFMDRGVIFKIIKKCLDSFDKISKEEITLMKLEFLCIICEHEHFIPLNLPFKQKTADVLYELNDEYCRKHYLIGTLLKEVEKGLDSASSTIRQKGVGVLRNLLAKFECDERFATPAHKSRIATLLFPIVPLTIKNFHRMYKKSQSGISKAKKPLRMDSSPAETNTSPQSPTPSMATSLVLMGDDENPMNTMGGGGGRTGAKKSLIGDFNSVSKSLPKSSTPDGDTPKPKQSLTSSSSILSTSKLKGSTDGLDIASVRELVDDQETGVGGAAGVGDEEEGYMGGVFSSFGLEETRDLLICFLFVISHIEQRVIDHWWVNCMDRAASTNSKTYSWATDVSVLNSIVGTELSTFFDLLELCVRIFEYSGRLFITNKWSKRSALLKQLEQTYTSPASNIKTKSVGVDSSRRSFAANLPGNKSSRISRVSSAGSLLNSSTSFGSTPDDVELYIRTEGNLANEVGLIVLETLDQFMEKFKIVLQDTVDHHLNGKIVHVLSTLLEIEQSTVLLKHIFASIRSYIHKFSGVLYRGNPEHCGKLCYQLLLCCNSTITTTKAEATALLYLLIRRNYEYFNKQQGFVRTDLQLTKALSKIATMNLPSSYGSLRRSLGVIATYAENDSRVKSGSFPNEIRDLMIRLRTVLSATSQMKEHRNDPEKLLDLQYSLAKSYANSPELRHTWLESMALLHIDHKNYTEAAQCYLHIAGLVAEYMKVSGMYSGGSRTLRHLSKNIEKEESGIRMDKGASREQRYSEVDLVTFLESSMSLLEQSEHYELTTNVFQLLLPYYQEQKNFKKLTDMYGKLHDCHKKILSTMESGKRYLGTYFRVAFYGNLFGEDNKKHFIYREPKVTGLAEITQRLVKLYSRKFGPETVQILQEAGKIDVDSLDPDKAHIQITHVQPYFTEEELQERTIKFEREHSLSKFMFEVPFTPSGEARGEIASQHMKKTLLITSHWFPYIVKRIPVVRDESWDLTPIEVAIEAIGKKRDDLLMEVGKRKHDLVKLQLLLQGSLSPQVNQGALEYANVFLKIDGKYPKKHTHQLKNLYSSFMQLCEVALTVHGQLIKESQILLHQDMLHKYQQMTQNLERIVTLSEEKPSFDEQHNFQTLPLHSPSSSSSAASISPRKLTKSSTMPSW